jgi:Fe2+ transport system protein FeoA
MDSDRLVPLDTLPAGRAARVRLLQAADDDALLKLAGLGILPGARLEVLRRSPAFCIRLNGACYAIDRSLARRILVEA